MTYDEAYDEIMTLFNTAWEAQGGAAPKVFWEDLAADAPKDEVLPESRPPEWARASMRFLDGQQGAFVLDTGGAPKKWERFGLVTIQIFTPAGTGLRRAGPLAKVVVDAFEGKSTPGGAWFRNVRRVDVGRSGSWFQVNVIANFEYDEVK